jgi:NADH-quinone oxidoreductase subunit G
LRAALYKACPHLGIIDEIMPARFAGTGKKKLPALSAAPFGEFLDDYYQTNPIARASGVMHELSALSQDAEIGATGTHG